MIERMRFVRWSYRGRELKMSRRGSGKSLWRVAIEAQNQSSTNLIGARLAQDIPDFRFPDSSAYKAANQICEEIARKQAICSDETLLKSVVSASHDHNAGHIATDEPEIRLVNRTDFSMKGGVAFSLSLIHI